MGFYVTFLFVPFIDVSFFGSVLILMAEKYDLFVYVIYHLD